MADKEIFLTSEDDILGTQYMVQDPAITQRLEEARIAPQNVVLRHFFHLIRIIYILLPVGVIHLEAAAGIEGPQLQIEGSPG